jgi:hypothetical protein
MKASWLMRWRGSQLVRNDLQNDYANELAKSRTGSMVLIGKSRGFDANPDSPLAGGTI